VGPITPVHVAGRAIGPGQRCLLVAEAGVNHNGDPALAHRLVDVAADCGADAVKFQTFRPELIASARAPKADYQIETTGSGESQLDMLRRLELPVDAYGELARHCDKRGILLLSTPFDLPSLDLLDELGLPAFKIASGELTNLPFLAAVGRRGKPVILSTGLADLDEVRDAVATLRRAGTTALVLLHCVSAYPADPADANLRAMRTLADTFGVPVGFSDHTTGIEVSLAAAALGAVVVEKHFTLSRDLPGPDHRASLEPLELAALVRGLGTVHGSLGSGDKRPAAAELAVRRVARRSLHFAVDAPAGTVLTASMLAILRPEGGLAPRELDGVLGRRLRVAATAGTPVTWDALE